MSTESYTPWAGLRPMTPDMMPLLFESNLGDIFYNQALSWQVVLGMFLIIIGLTLVNIYSSKTI